MQVPRKTSRVTHAAVSVALACLWWSAGGRAAGAPEPATDAPTPTYRTLHPIGETIAESLFGAREPSEWHPLSLDSLFSEGWDEPWVGPPRGSGGAPRQGWINAADGDSYRLAYVTYGFRRVHHSTATAQLGQFTLYAPLSRRLALITSVPFFQQNLSLGSGQPFLGGNGSGGGGLRIPKGRSGFGDLTVAPRVMLVDTRDFSAVGQLAATVPTGQSSGDGRSSLTPSVQFWSNPFSGFGLRGGIGSNVPLNRKAGGPSLLGQFAAGYTFTDHDVPVFGDFTLYLSTVVSVDVESASKTAASLSPGLRTHLGGDYYLLAAVELPVTGSHTFDGTGYFWFMKAW